MEIIGCANGHFYNPELYSSCPECARKNGGGSDFLGATEPVDFGNYANNFGNVGATEPVGFGGFSGGSSDIGKTEPSVNLAGIFPFLLGFFKGSNRFVIQIFFYILHSLCHMLIFLSARHTHIYTYCQNNTKYPLLFHKILLALATFFQYNTLFLISIVISLEIGQIFCGIF